MGPPDSLGQDAVGITVPSNGHSVPAGQGSQAILKELGAKDLPNLRGCSSYGSFTTPRSIHGFCPYQVATCCTSRLPEVGRGASTLKSCTLESSCAGVSATWFWTESYKRAHTTEDVHCSDHHRHSFFHRSKY